MEVEEVAAEADMYFQENQDESHWRERNVN